MNLSTSIYLFEVEAERIAKKAEAGQFVIVRKDEKAERIPLTIADYSREKGTITLIDVYKRQTRILRLKCGKRPNKNS